MIKRGRQFREGRTCTLRKAGFEYGKKCKGLDGLKQILQFCEVLLYMPQGSSLEEGGGICRCNILWDLIRLAECHGVNDVQEGRIGLVIAFEACEEAIFMDKRCTGPDFRKVDLQTGIRMNNKRRRKETKDERKH
jgi:hypothetical protein